MSGQTITLNIPHALAQELGETNEASLVELLERGLRAVRIERALDRYADGGVSFAAAAHQADVLQPELARHAYARGMEPPFSAETLAEELR